MKGQEWTLIPDIVKAWNNIIADEKGIPGGKTQQNRVRSQRVDSLLLFAPLGSAYEVTAKGMRLYPLEGPRTASSNVARAAGGADIVAQMRARL